MLSHRHLNRLAHVARTLMSDLVRHVQCGGDLNVELAYAQAELAKQQKRIAILPPDQLDGSTIDWECAGMVMSEALWLALAHHGQTGDASAAALLFSQRVGSIMRPRIWR